MKRAYESANAGGAGQPDDDFLGEDLDGVDDGPSVEEVDQQKGFLLIQSNQYNSTILTN